MSLSNKVFLISIAIFSYFLFVLMDSIVKYLFTFKKINLTRNFSVQIIRSSCLVACTFLTYLAVKYNDLINFYIIFFITPLFVSIFSYFFLKEKLSKFSIILIILSFITIIYALQPNET